MPVAVDNKDVLVLSLTLVLSGAPGDLEQAFAAAKEKREKAMWDLYDGKADPGAEFDGDAETPWTRAEPDVVHTPPRARQLRNRRRAVTRAGFEPGSRPTIRALVGGKGAVTSKYGLRVSPLSMGMSKHRGMDVAAPEGTPIYAAAAGTVTHAGWKGGYGRVVIIDHGGGLTTRYAHTWKLHVRAGQYVAAGQLIAGVGMTGRATGPHLHFEVRVQGKPVNPHWALKRYNAFRVPRVVVAKKRAVKKKKTKKKKKKVDALAGLSAAVDEIVARRER